MQKTLDLKVTELALRQQTMSLSKFDVEAVKLALALTRSHPTLVKAIRTRDEYSQTSQVLH